MANEYNNHDNTVAVQGVVNNHGSMLFNFASNKSRLELPYAKEAIFDSLTQQHKSYCFDGTRVDVRRSVEEWIEGENQHTILWIKGGSGTGKSTVARTIALQYHQKKRDQNEHLFASFFFSRDSEELSHTELFFTTIAMQLAQKCTSFHNNLQDAALKFPDITSRGFRTQWDELILEPLRRLKDRPKNLVLVIDALDECVREKDLEIIFGLFLENNDLQDTKLRVCVTSRPQNWIMDIVSGWSESLYREYNMDYDTLISESDISIFFREKLGKLPKRRFGFPQGWPRDEDIASLTKRTGGRFIYAATLCRFIEDGPKHIDPSERLNLICNDASMGESMDGLNAMYNEVLKQSRHFSDSDFRVVVGCITVALTPLSVNALSSILGIPTRYIEDIVSDLYTVLKIESYGASEPFITLHHHSFRDFIQDDKHTINIPFQTSSHQAHEILGRKCVELMGNGTLRRDICGLKKPGVLASEVERDRLENYIPFEIQYACTYWTQHLDLARTTLSDNDSFHKFLETHLLHWLEVLGWMQKAPEAVRYISQLQGNASKSDCLKLHALLSDIRRFVMQNGFLINMAPLQIYTSATIFAPENSLVRRLFDPQKLVPWVKRLPKVDLDWGSRLGTLEGHTSRVLDIKFSPDGKLLASLSTDRTIKVWKTETFKLSHVLSMGSSLAYAFEFSANGAVITTISDDDRITLWNAQTAGKLQSLKLNSTRSLNLETSTTSPDIRALYLREWPLGIFSPGGRLLALASYDDVKSFKISIWESKNSKLLKSLAGHSSYVECMTFSCDGRILVSGSDDQSIIIWNIEHGLKMQALFGHSSSIYALSLSSDGKLLVSTSYTEIRLWELSENKSNDASTSQVILEAKELQKLSGYIRLVENLAFSPDNRLLAWVNRANKSTLNIWSIDEASFVRKLFQSSKTMKELEVFQGSSDFARCISFSPDNQLLASGNLGGTVDLWEMGKAGKPGAKLRNEQEDIHLMVVSLNERFIATTVRRGNQIKIWDLDGALKRMIKCDGYDVYCLQFSYAGEHLAVGTSPYIEIWGLNGHLRHKIWTEKWTANSIAFPPDGKILAATSLKGNFNIWGIDESTSFVIMESKDTAESVIFSPCGQFLVSTSITGGIKWWNRNGDLLRRQRVGEEGADIRLGYLGFSPNGKFLVGLALAKVYVWESDTGFLLRTNSIQSGFTTSKFSLDDRYLHTDGFSFDYLSEERTESLRLPGNMYVDGGWLYRGSERALWLPSNYRPVRLHVIGNLVIIGKSWGNLIFIEFQPGS